VTSTEGEFKSGKMLGWGKIFYPDGERYEGEVKDEKLTARASIFGPMVVASKASSKTTSNMATAPCSDQMAR